MMRDVTTAWIFGSYVKLPPHHTRTDDILNYWNFPGAADVSNVIET